MQDLSLHILDIAENAWSAEADLIEISLEEDTERDNLRLEIRDDGQGMDPKTLARVRDPFFTTRTTRKVGLGLPLLEAAATRAGGDFRIESHVGKGTRVEASFRLGHIDLQPLGDIAQTLATLIMGHPEVDVRYSHTCDGRTFSLDTREIRSRLNGTPIQSPRVIRFILETVREGIQKIRRTS